MNFKIKSIISLTVAVLMILQMIPAFSAEEYELNITFNDVETNQVEIENLTISGGKASVAVTSPKNKGLFLQKDISETSVIAQGISDSSTDVVYSVDVMGNDKGVNLSFGTCASTTAASARDIKFFEIKNNVIFTPDGKKIGSVGKNGFKTISVISKKAMVCDYYINDTKILSDWSLSSTTMGDYVAVRQPVNNSCYIDNLRCYKGSRIDKSIKEAVFINDRVDVIAQKDFNGDVTFFDNRFCHTSGAPRYYRFTAAPKSNEIMTTRLIDYKSPTRTNYIYMKRKGNADDCFFDIALTMPAIAHADDYKYKYLKMEGDFKSDKLQDIIFTVRDSKSSTSSVDTSISINSSGSISGGGGTVNNAVTKGKWFHLLWALNLETKSFDVYLDGKKILADKKMNANMGQFNLLRVNLNYSQSIGDLYVDNFNVTGLVKPIVDGVETKTAVIPTDENIIEFLSDKVGMHAYGNLLHKDGVKTELKEKGIFDKKTEQYYVTADVLNQAFNLSLTDEGDSVTGDISVSLSGEVKCKDGKSFTLNYAPKIENGKMYIPVRQFAADALGKHVWWFKTGILLFADYEINIDTSDWTYQSERESSGCTVWNDIDYLNGYLQYKRPDAERLKEDYIKATGDTTYTKHPRLYYSAEEFDKLKEKYQSNTDSVFTKKIDSYIHEADSYTIDNLASYTFTDSMRTNIATQLANRFTAWGLAYNITGDIKYAQLGFAQFEKIATSFPDLNTAHVIDTGQALQALALGYDWLYNGFTQEQKKFAVKVLNSNLVILGDALYGRLSSGSQGAAEWRSIKLMNNYNTIVNSGITLAALATLEYETDAAFRYIADSTRSMEYSMQMFPPGGAWMEGVAYLSFVMQSFVPWALNMEKNFEQSYNILDGQGMEGILDFMISVAGPQGINQTGDGANSREYSWDSYFYLAKRYDNPVGAYMRWNELHSGKVTPTFLDIISYDFEAEKLDETVMENMPKMQVIDGMEIYSIRDTYSKDEANMYFSAHFGTSSGYHQHWDCGTFVLDLNGLRWAYDLGNDSYLLQNELGYPGYAIFRKRAEAHNILVLNPSAYGNDFEIERGNFAPIIDSQYNEYGGFVYADMDDIYKEASKMTLGYYIDDNMSSVTMRNEFTLKEATDCVWGFITKGDIEIDGNIAYVTQSGESIKLEAISSGTNVRWNDNGNPKPLPTSPQVPEQNKNAEYSQLQLMFDAPKGDNKLIIKISPMGKVIKPIEDITFSEWELPEKSHLNDNINTNFKIMYNDQEVTTELPVFGGVMPEIKVITEDPNAIVEITQATNVGEKTKIKVWDPKRLVYQVGVVSYYTASGANMADFKHVPITNVEVSSTPEANNTKDMMLDDDLLTRWTAMARGEYAIFDLGAITEIDGIAAGFYKGDTRQYFFNIYVSEDGANWRKVIENGVSKIRAEEMEVYAFGKREKARYIKFEGQGNSSPAPSDVNFNVIEFRALVKKY